ncbi:MAG: twin-arginine translocase TatA/TatE family subunit [Candidatus Eremiobacteraeota bacterium]|nr:twin-arginine translocase TatA/TatE family subunit [Candidatus Eremiobacteraeota bacterium]
MFSIPDIGLLGVIALLVFGPEQLPKIMRQVGRATREVQATSQSFIREMERAADVGEPPPRDFPPMHDPAGAFDEIPHDDVPHAPEASPDPRPILPHDL